MENLGKDLIKKSQEFHYEKKKKLLEVLDNCDDITSKDIWSMYENSRFCKPSNRNIKKIVNIENTITNNIPDDYQLIRVSELVPTGVYKYLSGMSPKRSVQTNRKLELCSDLSVSLALEWLRQRKKNINQEIFRICWFDTTFRPQSFFWHNDPKNIPYAHFSVYGNAFIWKEGKEFFFTKKYLIELLSHYLDIITHLNKIEFNIDNIEICLSSMIHTEEILKSYNKSLHELRDYQLRVRTDTGNEPTINDFLKTDINLYHNNLSSVIQENNDKNLNLSIWYLIAVTKDLEKLEEKYPVKINFMIWRSRWAGQYSSIAFSIFAKNKNGVRMDIADWGITNWWEKLLNNNERCLVGWLWTDLIANLYQK